jgi:hypothetical protein
MIVPVWGLLACIGSSEVSDKPQPQPQPDAVVVVPAPIDPVPVVAPGEPAPPIDTTNCEDEVTAPEQKGPGCITAPIECGQTVIGTTSGGGSWFDTRFYEKKYCTPATTRHDIGHERVYSLTLPAGARRAVIWLDTPCADLDLAAMRVTDFGSCPTIDSHVSQCEMWPKPGTARERVEVASQDDTNWLIVVESKTETDGPFALTVECKEGL